MKKFLLLCLFVFPATFHVGLSAQVSKTINNIQVFKSGTPNPIGLEADNTYLWVSHDNSSGGRLTKFSRSNGAYINHTVIGTGFLDFQSIGYARRLPNNSNMMWVLLPDGRLFQVNNSTNQKTYLTDLNGLNVNTQKGYDVYTGSVFNFSGFIGISSATFGDFDFAVNSDGSFDMYVSGISQAQTFPFLMQVRFKSVNGSLTITKAVLLASSRAIGAAGNVSTIGIPRGVAVSTKFKRVVTTLPFSYGTGSLFDALVSFPLTFDPTNGVISSEKPIVNKSIDIQSQGMTVSSDGTIFVSTVTVGSAQLGSPGKSLVAAFKNDLKFMSGFNVSSTLESLRDVALAPNGATGYATSSAGGVYKFSVVQSAVPAGLAHIAGDLVADVPHGTADDRSEGTETAPDLSKIVDVDVFPNPFSDRLNLRFTLPQPTECAFLLKSVDGKTILDFGTQTFDASVQEHYFEIYDDLPMGIYVFIAQLGHEAMVSKIVVKR